MSLLDLRRRIKSVKNTQKITRAMQLVAASKMKRAQDAALRSRPYADELAGLIGNLTGTHEAAEHPLMQPKEAGKVCSIVFTGDRGLCGSFNTNVIRRVLKMDAPGGHRLITVGRRGTQLLRRVSLGGLAGEFDGLGDSPHFLDTLGIAKLATDGFLSGEFRAVQLVYTKFVSTIAQEVTVMPLLPLTVPETKGNLAYTFEPSPEGVLEAALPRYIETLIWQALLESNASEQSARMVAMKSATDNAKELTRDLTLVMNKTRQAMITREISEIVAGVESMA